MGRDGGRFVVEIVRDGAMPAELVLLEDRVGAVGGQLHLEEPAQGVTRSSPRSCHAYSDRR